MVTGPFQENSQSQMPHSCDFAENCSSGQDFSKVCRPVRGSDEGCPASSTVTSSKCENINQI